MSMSKPVVPGGSRGSRKYWLDNLRVMMTTIVIVNHTAAAYGGGGTHYNPGGFSKTSPALLPYVAFHYAYGLGQFFWLSGNMTAQSLTKGSAKDFIKSKLLRLGVPALIFSIFIAPLQGMILREGSLRNNLSGYWKTVRDFRGWLKPGSGTVWYTMTLLVFDLCALAFHRMLCLLGNGKGKLSDIPGFSNFYAKLCRWGWIGVAASRFLVGTKFPFGYEFPIINVPPYYLPHHLYGYMLGYMAYALGKPRMTSLYDKRSGPLGNLSMVKACAVSLATLPVLFVPGWLRARNTEKKSEKTKSHQKKRAQPNNVLNDLRLSGWTTDAAIFALWNEFTFATVGPAFMSLWEQKFNRPGQKGLWSPRNAYAAYLLHSPISWFIGHGLHYIMCSGGKRPAWMDSKNWQSFGPMVMTAMAGYLETTASFGAGKLLIDYVPGAGSIL